MKHDFCLGVDTIDRPGDLEGQGWETSVQPFTDPLHSHGNTIQAMVYCPIKYRGGQGVPQVVEIFQPCFQAGHPIPQATSARQLHMQQMDEIWLTNCMLYFGGKPINNPI